MDVPVVDRRDRSTNKVQHLAVKFVANLTTFDGAHPASIPQLSKLRENMLTGAVPRRPFDVASPLLRDASLRV